MLQSAYLIAQIGADTAENERNVAEILPKNSHYPTGHRVPAGRLRGAGPEVVRQEPDDEVPRRGSKPLK